MKFKYITASCLLLTSLLCVSVQAATTTEEDVHAVVSGRVDTATTDDPTLSTEFSICLDEDPIAEPVGVIKLLKPLDSDRFDSKVFPQTGSISYRSEIKKTFPKNQPAPFLLFEDGQLWYRTKLEAVGEISRSQTFQDLSQKEVPATLTVQRDGLEYTLHLVSVTYNEIDPLAVGTLDHGYTVTKPTPPSHKDIHYTNAQGQEQTTTAALESCEQVEEYAWHPVEIPVRYYLGPYRIYQLEDTFVPYLDEATYWTALDLLVFEHLDLDPASWKITGSEWTTDWTYDPLTGVPVRYGVLYGAKYAARWVSTYRTDAEGTRFTADAIYSTDPATAELLLVHYRRFPLKTSTVIVSAVLFLLLFVVVVLYILKRRKKNHAEHHPGDQG